MAIFDMDPTKPEAAEYLNLLSRVAADLKQLEFIQQAMVEKLNGQDGSSDTHFTVHVTRYGYPNTATARASFNESASMVGNGIPIILQCAAMHKQ